MNMVQFWAVVLVCCRVPIVMTSERCNTEDLGEQYRIQEQTDHLRIIEQGTTISIKCIFSGEITWAFCREGTWIYEENPCSKTGGYHSKEITRQSKRRKKRFFGLIIRGIVCLFTRCSRPRPRDTTPPEIRNCPSDIYDEALPFQLYQFVSWAEPTAWDSNDGQVRVYPNGPKSPGSPFFEGTTRVGYYAKDRSNNKNTCNFNVHIRVVRCPTLSPRIADGYRVCHLSSDMVKGTVCWYGCYQGHDLTGSHSSSTCLRTGKWSLDKEPYCQKRKCSDIITMNPLKFECTSQFYFRSICTYSCSEGYDIPENVRRTKVCLASGEWNGDDPFCKDVQPPRFDQCPRTEMFFPGDNEDEALVQWKTPTVSDNHDYVVTPNQVSGPLPYTMQGVNTYSVVYSAVDSAGNKATECVFAVVVKQLRCPKLHALPYMTINCTGTRRGSSCSFSCDENSVLNGTHTTFCLRVGTMSYSSWKMDQQPFCQVSETCLDLTAPKHGALACDIWLGGKLCHPSCADGYSVLVSNPLPSLLVCLDDGTWLYEDQLTDCIDRQSSRRRLAVMSAEFYFSGDCHDTDVQIEIKEKFIAVIESSSSWKSKCQSASCNIENIRVICGDNSGKRSINNMRIDMDVYFETGQPSFSSHDYELEVATTREILHYLETQIASSNMTIGIGEMTFLSIQSSSLEVQCPNNSVPVYDELIGCVSCPIGSYYDDSLKTCVECARGSYQPSTAQSECIACPPMQTTAITGATATGDCEDACHPGTWSFTGLPPCTDCDIGYYEGHYGSISCSKCPGNKITLKEKSTNLTDCYDFDIVFPNGTEESYTELDVSPGTLSMPFFISFHLKSDKWADGDIVKLVSSADVLVQIDTVSLNVFGEIKTFPDGLTLSDKWYHIIIHLDANKSDLYVDGRKVLEFSDYISKPVLGPRVLIGGSGFSGTLSQLNIKESAQRFESSDIYTKCTSDNAPTGILNWSDFAYSILDNAYLNIPSICDDDDGCKENPCVNGTCIDTLGGYECVCTEGFTGSDCEINIDDCVVHACQNNATCIDQVNVYSCECQSGYTGELCETAMVDGEWSAWDNWTECSVSCGNGTRERRRSCSDPLPDNGGRYCMGSDTEVEECSFENCRECSELVATNHSTISCTNTTDMIYCTHVCNDGYWFDQDIRQNYKCGNETYYLWDFQTDDSPDGRLPFCSEIIESPYIYVDYTAFYDLQQCQQDNIERIEEKIQTKVTSVYKSLSCFKQGTCFLGHIEILNCNNDKTRKKREIDANVKYEATLSCDTSAVGTEDCYFELGDAITFIKEMEQNDSFDVSYDTNMYKIALNTSTSDARLDCPVGSIPYVAYCVPCSIGHYYLEGECTSCPTGTYQHFTGQTFCFKCPTGTTTKDESSISENECNVIVAVDEDTVPLYLIGFVVGIPVFVTLIVVLIMHCRHRQQSNKNAIFKLNSKTQTYDRVRKTTLDVKKLSQKQTLSPVYKEKECSYNKEEFETGKIFENRAFCRQPFDEAF